MKDGYIEKCCTPEKADYEKIRKYTRRDFSEEELYIFSLTLCSNDIDRDYEKFSVPALKELAVLFLGKTGIRDHSMKSSDQSLLQASCKGIYGKKRREQSVYYRYRSRHKKGSFRFLRNGLFCLLGLRKKQKKRKMQPYKRKRI